MQIQRIGYKRPGECVGFDSIERIRDGLRRYLVSAQDERSRVGFALAVSGHEHALSGSEFAGHFARAAHAAGIPHWHTFPRRPKMNAYCERFNRTLQEEFVDYHEDLLFTDLKAFNDKLCNWLLWYHTERPHHGLALNPPYSVAASCLPHTQCRMHWPNTPD